MDTCPKVSARYDVSSLNTIAKTPTPLHKSNMIDGKGSISKMASYLVSKHSYGPHHPKQIKHEDNIFMVIYHSHTSLDMVKGDKIFRLITHLDPFVNPTTSSNLT